MTVNKNQKSLSVMEEVGQTEKSLQSEPKSTLLQEELTKSKQESQNEIETKSELEETQKVKSGMKKKLPNEQKNTDKVKTKKPKTVKPPVPAGCLTCRQRHKKCSRSKPVCETCYKSSYICLWREPGTRFTDYVVPLIHCETPTSKIVRPNKDTPDQLIESTIEVNDSNPLTDSIDNENSLISVAQKAVSITNAYMNSPEAMSILSKESEKSDDMNQETDRISGPDEKLTNVEDKGKDFKDEINNEKIVESVDTKENKDSILEQVPGLDEMNQEQKVEHADAEAEEKIEEREILREKKEENKKEEDEEKKEDEAEEKDKYINGSNDKKDPENDGSNGDNSLSKNSDSKSANDIDSKESPTNSSDDNSQQQHPTNTESNGAQLNETQCLVPTTPTSSQLPDLSESSDTFQSESRSQHQSHSESQPQLQNQTRKTNDLINSAENSQLKKSKDLFYIKNENEDEDILIEEETALVEYHSSTLDWYTKNLSIPKEDEFIALQEKSKISHFSQFSTDLLSDLGLSNNVEKSLVVAKKTINEEEMNLNIADIVNKNALFSDPPSVLENSYSDSLCTDDSDVNERKIIHINVDNNVCKKSRSISDRKVPKSKNKEFNLKVLEKSLNDYRVDREKVKKDRRRNRYQLSEPVDISSLPSLVTQFMKPAVDVKRAKKDRRKTRYQLSKPVDTSTLPPSVNQFLKP
jgi:hypothetical protein